MQNPHFSALAAKHARLEREIISESQRPRPDGSIIAALKKQKLRIKEELAAI